MSGPMPPQDTFLYGYSLIDLLSTPISREKLLDRFSVNGFMNSRSYTTDAVAELHQYHLAKAFAVPSFDTSAATYKTFVKYGFRNPDPMMWVLKGNTEETIHRKLRRRLEQLGCEIKLNNRVSWIRVQGQDGRPKTVPSIRYVADESTLPHASEVELDHHAVEEEIDYLILAVPPGPLITMLSDDPDSAEPSRVFDADPDLEAIASLRGETMVSIDLYFNKKLPKIPKEHVVLLGSEHALSYIDNSQLWPNETNTFLTFVASESSALVNLSVERAAIHIINALKDYISFEESDIDFQKSHIQRNAADSLFINEVGNWDSRPKATCKVHNLLFAGDFCQTEIDVVSLEAAVTSGLLAAQALQSRAMRDLNLRPSGKLCVAIEIITPDSYPDEIMQAWALPGAPIAYAAKWWSMANEAYSPTGRGTTSKAVARDTMELVWAPYTAAARWWEKSWSAYGDMFFGKKKTLNRDD